MKYIHPCALTSLTPATFVITYHLKSGQGGTYLWKINWDWPLCIRFVNRKQHIQNSGRKYRRLAFYALILYISQEMTPGQEHHFSTLLSYLYATYVNMWWTVLRDLVADYCSLNLVLNVIVCQHIVSLLINNKFVFSLMYMASYICSLFSAWKSESPIPKIK